MATKEELQLAVADESLSAEERAGAAELLKQLEQPLDVDKIHALITAGIEKSRREHQAKIAHENTTLKMCSACYRRQPKENDVCELCGQDRDWELTYQDKDGEDRERWDFIDAANRLTNDEIRDRIRHSSTASLKLVQHWVRILTWRGIEAPPSFWGHHIGDNRFWN